MLDLESFQKGLKCTWIKSLLDNSKDATCKWKLFINGIFKQAGIQDIIWKLNITSYRKPSFKKMWNGNFSLRISIPYFKERFPQRCWYCLVLGLFVVLFCLSSVRGFLVYCP